MIFRIELADEFSFSSQIFSYRQNLGAGLFLYVELELQNKIPLYLPLIRMDLMF